MCGECGDVWRYVEIDASRVAHLLDAKSGVLNSAVGVGAAGGVPSARALPPRTKLREHSTGRLGRLGGGCRALELSNEDERHVLRSSMVAAATR